MMVQLKLLSLSQSLTMLLSDLSPVGIIVVNIQNYKVFLSAGNEFKEMGTFGSRLSVILLLLNLCD